MARTGRPPKAIKDRFWLHVEKTETCWVWNGDRNKFGYGVIRCHVGYKVNKKLLAHRVSWQISVSEIPDGKYILHRCDNPPCVNPEHLFIGTRGDNNRDMFNKGRGKIPHYRGSKNPSSRLKEEDIIEIRRSYAEDSLTQKQIGDKFNVHKATIRSIILGKTWGHIGV